MAKSNYAANALLAFQFDSTPLPWAGASAFQVALHTADPTPAGNQSSSEANYTGYARRSLLATKINVAAQTATSTVDVTFPTNEGASQSITHVSIGYGGEILYYVAVGSVAIAEGQQPNIPAGTLTVSES